LARLAKHAAPKAMSVIAALQPSRREFRPHTLTSEQEKTRGEWRPFARRTLATATPCDMSSNKAGQLSPDSQHLRGNINLLYECVK
jgi:hypothetical protein